MPDFPCLYIVGPIMTLVQADLFGLLEVLLLNHWNFLGYPFISNATVNGLPCHFLKISENDTLFERRKEYIQLPQNSSEFFKISLIPPKVITEGESSPWQLW